MSEGKRWSRLTEYLIELCEKGLVHMENKTDTIGHKVYKITSLGMEAFEKIKDLNRLMGRYDGDE